MTRQIYSVTVTDNTGAVLANDVRFAMNAGIRTSEALVREMARSEGAIYHGATPQRVGDVYTRDWTSISGITVTARVNKLQTEGV